MRLSPKHIFLGIVAFGLPIALTTGWALGVPTPDGGAGTPQGAAGIGAAPSAVASASCPQSTFESLSRRCVFAGPPKASLEYGR